MAAQPLKGALLVTSVACWFLAAASEPSSSPDNVRITFKNESYVELAWDAVDYINGEKVIEYYTIYSSIALPLCGRDRGLDRPKATTYGFPLVARCLYNFGVAACTANGCSNFSNPISFTAVQRAPSHSPTISSVQAGPTDLLVEWTPISIVVQPGFLIAFETQLLSDGLRMLVNDTDIHSAYRFGRYTTQFGCLKPGTTYEIAGRAYTEAGPGPFGAASTYSTQESPIINVG